VNVIKFDTVILQYWLYHKRCVSVPLDKPFTEHPSVNPICREQLVHQLYLIRIQFQVIFQNPAKNGMHNFHLLGHSTRRLPGTLSSGIRHTFNVHCTTKRLRSSWRWFLVDVACLTEVTNSTQDYLTWRCLTLPEMLSGWPLCCNDGASTTYAISTGVHGAIIKDQWTLK
jgi:hypothetical protein